MYFCSALPFFPSVAFLGIFKAYEFFWGFFSTDTFLVSVFPEEIASKLPMLIQNIVYSILLLLCAVVFHYNF